METAAARKLHDDLMAQAPQGARHDSDICPFCVDQATESATTSGIPPGSAGPDVSDSIQIPSTEGGTTKPMSENNMISTETHAALMDKAVKDATSATEAALTAKVEESKTLSSRVEELESENANLKTENERINKELDASQVGLKAAQDEVASLKADIAAKDEAAAKAEVASKRTEQVKNLGLFADDYVSEKASSWAELSDEAWTERMEEWQTLKPASSDDSATTKTDSASAMSGTTEDLTKDKSTDTASSASPRRAALGLAPKAS